MQIAEKKEQILLCFEADLKLPGRCEYLAALQTPLRTILQLEEQQIYPLQLRLCPSGNKMLFFLGGIVKSIQIFDLQNSEFVDAPHDDRNPNFPHAILSSLEGNSDNQLFTEWSFRSHHFLFLWKQEETGEWIRVVDEPILFHDKCIRNDNEIFLLDLLGGANGTSRVEIRTLNTGDGSIQPTISFPVERHLVSSHGFSVNRQRFAGEQQTFTPPTNSASVRTPTAPRKIRSFARLRMLRSYVCDGRWLLISLSGVLAEEEKTYLYIYEIATCQLVCERAVNLHADLVQAEGQSSVFFGRYGHGNDVTTLKVDGNGNISTGFSFRLPVNFGGSILAATQSTVLVWDGCTLHVFNPKTGKRCYSLNIGFNTRVAISADQKELFVLNGSGTLNVFCLEEPHI